MKKKKLEKYLLVLLGWADQKWLHHPARIKTTLPFTNVQMPTHSDLVCAQKFHTCHDEYPEVTSMSWGVAAFSPPPHVRCVNPSIVYPVWLLPSQVALPCGRGLSYLQSGIDTALALQGTVSEICVIFYFDGANLLMRRKQSEFRWSEGQQVVLLIKSVSSGARKGKGQPTPIVIRLGFSSFPHGFNDHNCNSIPNYLNMCYDLGFNMFPNPVFSF